MATSVVGFLTESNQTV